MLKKDHWVLVVLGVAILTSLGCRSFSSVFLFRNESNSEWETKRLLHGIPITLKVPTHVKIDILEKSFIVHQEGDGFRHFVPPVPLRDVKHHFIENDKVFVVDLKRPAAGSLTASVDLDPEQQYFNKIDRKYTDTTIEAVTGLLGAVAQNGLFGVKTTDGKPAVQTDGPKFKIHKPIISTVASEIFEIDAADFEVQVSEFLSTHLNDCHSCDQGSNVVNVPGFEFGFPVQGAVDAADVAPAEPSSRATRSAPENSNPTREQPELPVPPPTPLPDDDAENDNPFDVPLGGLPERPFG